MAILLPNGKQSFTSAAGLPLIGGKVYTYAAGTNTPQVTYADAAQTVPNTNPVILDARGEASIFWSGAYKVILRDLFDALIWSVDNISTIDPLAAQFAALGQSGGSALLGFVQAGGGAVATTVQAKLRERVSVWDYMTAAQITSAKAGNFPDCTAAFTAAQTASKYVDVPPGSYGLINLRILNSRWIIGSGRDNCFLKQLDATQPAINCLSDVTVGQLKGIRIAGFYVRGADAYAAAGGGNSPVPGGKSAVVVAAFGAYAVWDSHFSFFAKNTLTALEVQGNDAANVFESEFHVTSEGTRYIAVIFNGGTYNRCHFFLTQCDNWAITCGTSGSEVRCVSENCQYYNSQGSVIRAEVEGIIATFMPASACIVDEGFYNVYVKPVINLPTVDAGRVSFGFKPFYGTTYIEPALIGPVRPTWPVVPTGYPWNIVGGARGSAAGKIEGNFNFYQQRMLSVQGDITDWSSRKPRDKVVEYLAPASPFNMQVNTLTDAVVFNPSAAIGLAGISFVQYSYPGSYPGDGSTEAATLRTGMAFTFSTTTDITGINWGSAGAGLPTTLLASTPLRIIYSENLARFIQY